ncbi:MAG: WecB/TagA/CpsF family glycosyltransferase [Nitrosomonadales bacterium]|nr:WecB/TagA/CpsF family glycosyltransferase [Nitrosomonadales bacterium]
MNSKGWQHRWLQIIDKTTLVSDEVAEQRLLHALAQSPVKQAYVLSFINAHAMNILAKTPVFFDAMMESDLILRDGIGMSMLFKHMGIKPGMNMNGTDFIPKILQAFEGRKVALWGTESPYLQQAAEQVQTKFGVNVASMHHGFDADHVYLQLALVYQPELIVLGMGMPKQERVANLLRQNKVPAVIVNGGAIIDFLGNKINRAPTLFRRLGLEWLYRLSKEPIRLSRRYLIGNLSFIWRKTVL